jgi:hypothetical protein
MNRLSLFIRSRFNSGAWAVALLIIIEALSAFLSGSLTVGKLTPSENVMPTHVLYSIWLVVVIGVLFITVMLWLVNDRRRLRLAIFAANSLLTGQLFIATLLLVVRLLQSVKITVPVLIGDALIIFLTNILIFALWYWFIDSANTHFFKTTDTVSWDFLFPQRQASYPGYENWTPHFSDYLFLAYFTGVAFSAADTLPLSRAAKVLMVTQSAISLIAITAVVGTAINILASNA